MSEAPVLVLDNITKSYATQDGRVDVLEGVNFAIPRGTIVCFFGPNGAGKSTLMRIIAGLELPTAGEVVRNLRSAKTIPMVFQDYRSSLLPWRSVFRNLTFPLEVAGVSRWQARERVEEIVGRFQVDIDLERRVHTLSGGEAQTVCLLRALLVQPEILILDEPLSALDYHAKLQVRQQIIEARDLLDPRPTVLCIHHDLDDAIYMGDMVVFLRRRPGSVYYTLPIPLPRPRGLEIETSTTFAGLKAEALRLFQECLGRKLTKS